MESCELMRLIGSLTEPWRTGDLSLTEQPLCCLTRKHQIQVTRTVSHMLLLTVKLLISMFYFWPSYLQITIELAHQWFGNLVTMDWWSELWLNEGFATWVGWYAIDHFYPGKYMYLYN